MDAASPSAIALIAFVCAQRLLELRIAARNTKALLGRGGWEVGAEHYPFIVALHLAWIGAIAAFGWSAQLVPAFVLVYAALQILRVWILTSLGDRWTTRIILVDEPVIRLGPYRYVSHPNYWLVAAELIAVPMALGLWRIVLMFTVLNAMMMVVRIRAENHALADLPKTHDSP